MTSTFLRFVKRNIGYQPANVDAVNRLNQFLQRKMENTVMMSFHIVGLQNLHILYNTDRLSNRPPLNHYDCTDQVSRRLVRYTIKHIQHYDVILMTNDIIYWVSKFSYFAELEIGNHPAPRVVENSSISYLTL